MSPAVVATAFGGPEVLSVIDVVTPDPGPERSASRSARQGVNPIDWKVRSGLMGADPASLPMRLGREAAGVISAVGEGVESVAVGDQVIAYFARGAYAAELVVAVDAITPKPDSIDWQQAAGPLLTRAIAVHALAAVDVQSGDTVLVHGAAGGVGLATVQLAVARGAAVIATASRPSHDLLRELGAVAITYGEGLADRVRAAAPGGVDAALDLVGTEEAVDVSLELVADRARIVSIAAFGRAGNDGIRLIGGPGADAARRSATPRPASWPNSPAAVRCG